MGVTHEPPRKRPAQRASKRKPPKAPPQEPHHVAIGRRIALLRELAGIELQREIADAAGIDRGTYNRAERGRQKVAHATYEKIMQALQKRVQFSVVWFLHGEGEPPGSDGSKAVETYLTSEYGMDASAEVQAELRKINWGALSAVHRTTKAIHRLREVIERNLILP